LLEALKEFEREGAEVALGGEFLLAAGESGDDFVATGLEFLVSGGGGAEGTGGEVVAGEVAAKFRIGRFPAAVLSGGGG
jgi:hypothetical protein